MSNKKLSQSSTTDMTNNVSNYEVYSEDTYSTFYICDWSKWNGYYQAVPELKAVIDKKAVWTVGKGYICDDKTEKILSKWNGNGKDTANDIFENAVKVYSIGGDFFAEIIKNKRGEIKNLKPLNPGTIKIVADDFGRIKRYDQFSYGKVDPVVSFSPDEIFHLQFNRIADQIHGTGSISAVEDVVLALKEAKSDLKVVFHRYVKPVIISQVDTDDEAEISAYKRKLDSAVANGENMVIPKGTVDNIERVSIPQFSTLDPLPWIKHLISEFLRAEGVPDVILGMGDSSTEATSKILYLAFQQMIEHNQNFVEKQVKAQLGLEIEFEFPASLEPLLFNQQQKAEKLNNPDMGMVATK